MSRVSKEQVEQVVDARWAAFERMARETNLPNHHILSIELLRRPHREQTLAVITAVKDRKAVQYVLVADAHGGRPRPVITVEPCHPPKHATYPDASPIHLSALNTHAFTLPTPSLSGSAAAGAPVARAAMAAATLDDPADPDSIPLGVPPPKEDPPPSIVALGTVLLATTFNLGEQVT